MIHVEDVVELFRFLIDLGVHFRIRTTGYDEQILDLLSQYCFVFEPTRPQYFTFFRLLDCRHDHNHHECIIRTEVGGFSQVRVVVAIRDIIVALGLKPFVCEGKTESLCQMAIQLLILRIMKLFRNPVIEVVPDVERFRVFWVLVTVREDGGSRDVSHSNIRIHIRVYAVCRNEIVPPLLVYGLDSLCIPHMSSSQARRQ